MPGGAWLLSLSATLSAGAFAACSSDPTAPVDDPIVTEDTGSAPDTKKPDTTPAMDSATTDTAVQDTSTGPDTFVADTARADVAKDNGPDTAPVLRPFSTKLSEMDLYSNFATKAVDTVRNVPFAPNYALWSDGALKKRWVSIPTGGKIDNSSMDYWKFPIGTRFWKEFSTNGLNGTLLETRLVERIGDTEYRMGAYVWNAAGTEAEWTLVGAQNVNGTNHDVPSLAQCQRCHDGEPGRGLSFSALQLYNATPLSLADLTAKNMFTVGVNGTKNYGATGTAVDKAAMGYLHANCGHCHNPNNAQTFPIIDMILRLSTGDADGTIFDTKMYKQIVNRPTSLFVIPGQTASFRVVGGNPAQSAIMYRMSRRGETAQMPPIASEEVHTVGVEAVRAWIETLPPPPDAGVSDAASGG